MEFKAGDILYCHTPCIMNISGEKSTTKGEKYEIDGIFDEQFTIMDDSNHQHFFDIEKYKEYFYLNIKEIRKDKLKKINKKYGTAKIPT